MVYKIEAILFSLLVVVHMNRSCAAKLPTGTGPSSELSRIAHGWDTSIIKHPYMVNIWMNSEEFISNNMELSQGQKKYLLQAVEKSEAFNCGGTLISSTCVLTAAHCVFDKYNRRLYPNQIYKIYGGNTTRGKGVLLSEVESVFFDDGYDPETFDMDVAIIKLTEPWKNTNMKKIEIDFSEVNEGDKTIVAGWGRTETYDIPKNLREINITIISTEECQANYQGSEITENMFCVRGFQNAGQCGGDSGGPIIRNGKQIGIVSFSRDTTCGENDYPRAEAKLSSSRVSKFLRQTIANKC